MCNRRLAADEPPGWYGDGSDQCLRFSPAQAQGISRPAMYNNLVFVVVNGLCNWLFIFGGPFQYLHKGHLFHWTGVGFIGERRQSLRVTVDLNDVGGVPVKLATRLVARAPQARPCPSR